MPLAPTEIEQKDFTVALRGYDKEEVQAFLRAIAKDYRDALKMGNYEAVGQEVGKILETVNASAVSLKERAEKEVHDLVTRARKEAQDLQKAAENEAQSVRRAASDEAENTIQKAEQEAKALRDRTSKQVEGLLAEAERAAADIRKKVEQDTVEMVGRANARVEALRRTEAELTQKLTQIEGMLKNVRNELGPPETDTMQPGAFLEQEEVPLAK